MCCSKTPRAPSAPHVYVAGEKGSPLTTKAERPVRIEEIRAKYNKNNLYFDPDFLPGPSSIGDVGGDDARGGSPTTSDVTPIMKFKWKRPHEICKQLSGRRHPEFAVAQDSFARSRASEYDIEQSSYLGDCWYMAALQALARKPAQLNFVILVDNYTGFEPDSYCGAFHFRFYIMAEAKWVDVVVDDLLPVDRTGLPAFAKVSTRLDPHHAEFWPALVEKAYAKVHGSYYGIEGGFPGQALENFTGGFSEMVDLSGKRDGHGVVLRHGDNNEATMQTFILSYNKRDVFLALTTYADDDPARKRCKQGYTKYGLVGPHAYAILDAQVVNFKNAKVKAPQKGKTTPTALLMLK